MKKYKKIIAELFVPSFEIKLYAFNIRNKFTIRSINHNRCQQIYQHSFQIIIGSERFCRNNCVYLRRTAKLLV